MNVEGGELGQQEAQQGLLVRDLAAGGSAGFVRSSAMSPSLEQQLAEHRFPVVEGTPEVEVGPDLAEPQEKRPESGRDESFEFEGRGRAGSSPARRARRSPPAGSPRAGSRHGLPVLVEQGRRGCTTLTRTASSTKDSEGQPAPTQPAIDQLHHHHVELLLTAGARSPP